MIQNEPICHEDFEYALLKLSETISNTQLYGNNHKNNYVEKYIIMM